ncbi:FAD-dependent oxidoreductase [Leptospira terpstrae]|uniref:Dihydrolipoyl dehydrogenase n=1 Tax=Leptospira terpstrae serovar Hualin str. LT 11-33 = ATCC 700639 TaxID=1257025 RepID=N1VRX1_9LEPT|nr:FAD-dependent oxidoreductase [Leptospira terpstrae]EMY59737.1 putative dihydrolipoyl dehydrogenase [Leptospira terpstrae serovar Hualin str. LT 11-33 = ATCC 700639]
MSINRFDLLAIGGGPAAQKAAIQASKMGKKAAIIEKDPYLGGGCVHYGTIPSKSLQETSRFYRNLKLSKLHGLQSPQTATLTLLIALGQCVVNLKAPIEYFTEHIFNYPTMIGAYKNAANDALLREK